MTRRPRIAIAHDYLTQFGGAERVVLSMLRAFPGAAVHTTLYDPAGTYPEFGDVQVHTSGLNHLAPLRRSHRAALPLLPMAASRVRIDADVVIASTSGWAHGFPTSGKKLAYCHSPARWVYLPDQYLGQQRRWLAPALRVAGGPLGAWDRRAAATVDRYLCNSRVIQQRVRAAYGVEAQIVPPPHSIAVGAEQEPISDLSDWPADGGHHLLVSRLLPYKNVDQAIAAFAALPEHRLLIIGRGPLEASLRANLPANVRIVSGVSDAQLRWAYAHATALIAPSHEDYGLTPLEAAAFGVPTIALRAGGYLDTISEGITGTFFTQPTAEVIGAAVRQSRAQAWSRDAITAHADRFSERRFIEALRSQVDELA